MLSDVGCAAGDRTGDRSIRMPLPLSLTKLLGLADCALAGPLLLIPRPVFPLTAATGAAVATDLGRGAVGVPLLFVGVDVALSTLDDRADERGVTVPADMELLSGVVAALTLGVNGSALTVGLGLVPTVFAVGVAFSPAATRGVMGGLAGRLEALGRSDDIVIVMQAYSNSFPPNDSS